MVHYSVYCQANHDLIFHHTFMDINDINGGPNVEPHGGHDGGPDSRTPDVADTFI